MEAGVNQELEGLMLLGWVAIAGENGREGIASTARLPLPAAIAARRKIIAAVVSRRSQARAHKLIDKS